MSLPLISRYLRRAGGGQISPYLLGSYGGTVGHHHALPTLFRRTLLLQSAASEIIRVEKFSGSDAGIVELTVDLPEKKNAIGLDMLRGIRHAIEDIHGDDSAKLVLVTSAVPGVFCAGADLKERRQMSTSEVHQFTRALRGTFRSLEQLPIPTIAAVDGVALGGGLELALACDIRICSENALLGLPETGLAIMPGAGGTLRLPRVVGVSRAKDLIFTGRKIDGKEALSIGLVNYCVPSGEVYPKALEIARVINEKGPMGVRLAKESINRGSEVDMDTAVAVEGQCYDHLLYTQDRIEALDAFAEKRKPKFVGK